MVKQMIMDFETPSPINVDRLSGQNRRLYDYLKAGNRIHCFSEARRLLRIGYLNSRVSDLINVHKIPVQKTRIKVRDVYGEETTVMEYFLEN